MDDFDNDLGDGTGGLDLELQPLAAWRPPATATHPPAYAGAGQRQYPWRTQRTSAPAPHIFEVIGGIGDGITGSELQELENEGQAEDGEGSGGGSGSGTDSDSQGRSSQEDEGTRGGSASGGSQCSLDDSDDAGGSDLDSDELVEADFGMDRSSVLSRIEGFISDSIERVARGQLPELELVSRSAQNAHMVADRGPDGGGHDDVAAAASGMDDNEGGSRLLMPGQAGAAEVMQLDGGGGSDGEDATGASQGRGQQRPRPAPARTARHVRLGSLMQTKTITRNQGRQACTVARVFKVLEAVHELLRTGRQATQRDLYYKLLGPPLFPNAAAVNGAIQDVVALLRVPRSSLGITCSSRGAVAGRLHLRDGAGRAWVDCGAAGAAGVAIPGELAAVERLSFRVAARYIVVVEKDCIFQRLAQDGLHEMLPMVLVTAKGMPDLATRAFLCRLSAAAPGVPVLGLVDWNPSGVCILATYKFGNPRTGLEGSRFALPRLRWLGVVHGMLDGVPRSAFHALSKRDTALLAGLRQRLAGHRAWLDELGEMEERGLKCDIEALYTVGGFHGLHQHLSRRILQQQYL